MNKCFATYRAAYKWKLIIIANSVYDSFSQRLSLLKMSHSCYCNYSKLITCSFLSPGIYSHTTSTVVLPPVSNVSFGILLYVCLNVPVVHGLFGDIDIAR